ncbi:MAG: HAMP domain-containing sensor histidine kinase [Rhodobacterales bacterium]
MFLKSLSGRFLLLTIIFVMLAEVLIFVPSVARFRVNYLQTRLNSSQLASLALLASPNDMVTPELEAELLRNADVLNVALQRDSMRELILSSPMKAPIEQTYDLRNARFWTLIDDAMMVLWRTDDRVIRVRGEPVNQAGLLIEAALNEKPLRSAMIAYGLNILSLSLFISIVTGALLFIAVQCFLVLPISRVICQIREFEAAPEDVRKIIQPRAGVTELREAEIAIQSMQTQLSQSLKHKGRLADLGGAVAKISHDLRNILTTTQLLADRMERSDDPMVQKIAPKLLTSLSRAVNLCDSTLRFGKAEETAPNRSKFSLKPLLREVIEAEMLAIGDADIEISLDVKEPISLRADREQLYRIVNNIVHNACQVLSGQKRHGVIKVKGRESPENWVITVLDNGPGLPKKARDNLFTPFEGGARRGGSGLGLAISAELVKAHGGTIDLVVSGLNGSTFEIILPKDSDK